MVGRVPSIWSQNISLQGEDIVVFIARHYASTVYAVIVCTCVCLCVCLSVRHCQIAILTRGHTLRICDEQAQIWVLLAL